MGGQKKIATGAALFGPARTLEDVGAQLASVIQSSGRWSKCDVFKKNSCSLRSEQSMHIAPKLDGTSEPWN